MDTPWSQGPAFTPLLRSAVVEMLDDSLRLVPKGSVSSFEYLGLISLRSLRWQSAASRIPRNPLCSNGSQPGGERGAFLLRPNEGTNLTGMAVHTPEQIPEGTLPVHLPLPRDRANRPVPWALRGPATAFIRICPEAETWPST